MKKNILLLLLFIFLTGTSVWAQFEIRTAQNAEGYLEVQMRCTNASYLPTTSTTVNRIRFAIRWPDSFWWGPFTSVSLMCSDYNIIHSDLNIYYNFSGYSYQIFTESGSFTCPEDWTLNSWITIAELRAVSHGYYGNITFSIAPNSWSSLQWYQNNPLYQGTPAINGNSGTYAYPNYYNYIWIGGDASGNFDYYSWNNPKNWINNCGHSEIYAPDTYGTCIIPSGVADYPKYSQPTNSDSYTSYCYDLLIETGGEVNFTGDHSSGNYTQLYIANDLTIQDGGTLDLVNDVRVDVSNETKIYGSDAARVGPWSVLYAFGNLSVYNTNGLTIEKTGWVQAVDVSTYVGAPTAIVIKEGDGVISATGGGPGNFYQKGPISYGSGGSVSVGTFIKNSAAVGSFYIHMVGPTVDDPAYTGSGTGVPLGNFDLLTLGTFAYLFDEPTGQWENVYPIPYPIQTATGLILSDTSSSDNTYTMEGEILSGDVYKSVTSGGSNLELISNPYPTALNWEDFQAHNSSLIGTTFRIWNPSVGNYGTYTSGMGGVGTNGVLFVIQSGQGFFVTTTGNGSLTFSDDDKYFSRYPILKNRENLKLLKVSAEGNTYKDELIIKFTGGATFGYDKDIEAKKWNSYYSDATEIYSLSEDSVKLSINSLPPTGNEIVSVPVHFKCGADSSYKLTFKNLSSFIDGTEVWLEDKLLNTDWVNINLQDSIYIFNGSPQDDIDRFVIHFFGPTNINNDIIQNENDIKIYSYGHNVYVLNNSDETIEKITVYNLMGSKIYEGVANHHSQLNKISISGETAYYVVRVLTDKNVYSGKVFIMK